MSELLRDPVDPSQLQGAIAAAWQRRAALAADPDLDAYRIFHGWHEGCPGLEIDRYGDAALIAYRERLSHLLEPVVEALQAVRSWSLIVGKCVGRRSDAQVTALRGAMPAEPLVVREAGLQFLIEPWRPRNPGLFLDARPARAWLRQHARGRRVLNLFSNTGSLGLAAMAGGAEQVVHVDSQRGVLARCKANHERNQLPVDDRALVEVNIYQHLRRQAARRQRWDGVIIDAPPGPPRHINKKRAPDGEGIGALVPRVAPTLASGGWLLCFFHHSRRDRSEHEAEVLERAGVPLEICWRGESGADFPEPDPRRRLRLTAFCRSD